MRSTLDTKDPAGVQIMSFVCTDDLSATETITGSAITVSVVHGIDANPSALISGSATISGGTVLQKIIGGLDGVTYAIRGEITLNTGRVLVGVGVMPVRVA